MTTTALTHSKTDRTDADALTRSMSGFFPEPMRGDHDFGLGHAGWFCYRCLRPRDEVKAAPHRHTREAV